MAATKKPAPKKLAVDKADEPVADAPIIGDGYVIIERDGMSALVDVASVPELEVQGWKPVK